MINENRVKNCPKDISDSLAVFDAYWLKANEGKLMQGTCGYAVVLISFGNMRKIKKMFLDAGLISEKHTWDSYGKKCYVVQHDRGQVPTQNICYYEDRAAVVLAAVRDALQDEGDVFIHAWVD